MERLPGDTIRKTSAGDASGLAWFRSSHSSGPEGDSCVESATEPGAVHVRGSKNAEGARPAFSPAARAGFVPYAVEGRPGGSCPVRGSGTSKSRWGNRRWP
ncbi:DUF397 domain-containing protein [Streptomyces sp. NPDC051041]|uniref:DUF397 domain-containing protein n=1 Tax=Streptomyces sp. NPDC051041 TaxID=3365640 RepID=UPI0037AA17A1